MQHGIFRDFLDQVPPLRLKEPLAAALGALKDGDAVIEYSFGEVVKMAGHACPTVSGAYLICRKALEALYPSQIPVRGDMAITVYGEQDEGVYGVMGQVLSFISGAAPASGFRGLGPKFRRKDLLRYDAKKPNPQALSFEFRRTDNGKSVLLHYFPARVPSHPVKAERMGDLMEKVLWDAARPEEMREFQDLWMSKVEAMLLHESEIENWLQIEVRKSS